MYGTFRQIARVLFTYISVKGQNADYRINTFTENKVVDMKTTQNV